MTQWIWRLVFLIVAVAAGGTGYYLYRHGYLSGRFGDELRSLAEKDLNEKGEAGRVEHLTGTARMKTPADSKQAPVELTPTSTFGLNTLFRVEDKGVVQIMTHGNWLVALDAGEFIFENAEANAGRTVHHAWWYVRNGTFRARPHDYDPSEHVMRIRTDAARIYLAKAEIGMRVRDGGGGQIWLVSGSATVVWNDGRRKQLTARGMDYL